MNCSAEPLLQIVMERTVSEGRETISDAKYEVAAQFAVHIGYGAEISTMYYIVLYSTTEM